MISGERALATSLSDLDDVALTATLVARGVSPTAAWRDFFDAAAGLLDAASLDRILTRLPRATLMALTDATVSGVPSSLALLDESGRPYDAVAARVSALRTAHPEAFEPVEAPPARAIGGEAAAAERAFTSAGALADILLACLHAPVQRTGAGAVSAADRRRLIEAGAVSSAEELDDLLASAAAAELASPTAREWLVTAAGELWMEASTLDRWRTVVEGFLRAVPAGLRTPDGGIADPGTWQSAYPLDPEWPERSARIARTAVRWGLLGDDATEPAWTSRIRRGGELDTAALAEHLPAEIDRVYLQADLTAIAPGPLAPALELRLRSIAHRESRAQASTYRFTTESLGSGLTEGETAESIRGFLSALSLTGIPQPLDYLIESTAARHGLVRVGADEASGRTRVVAADRGLLDAIAVDQALRPLGLLRDGEDLVSRVERDAVYWSLVDARYPVVAIDDAGEPESLHRRTGRHTTDEGRSPQERYAGLVATLRASLGTDGDAAWLGRELDQAVRNRAVIVVVVRLPDGVERTFTLEASGLGGGRLRGRDRAADIERTLPVSSITSVRPA
ncbi:helicase-associated domain-containing protein [Microbacterium sp.]|uniref:helicase-associated domain-containing protein n=1 Tax=Microbacterium sp. TaxID=51671 RepID=UPI003F6FB0BA